MYKFFLKIPKMLEIAKHDPIHPIVLLKLRYMCCNNNSQKVMLRMTFCELLLLLSTFKATFYEIILHLFEYYGLMTI